MKANSEADAGESSPGELEEMLKVMEAARDSSVRVRDELAEALLGVRLCIADKEVQKKELDSFSRVHGCGSQHY
jgi:hypothetical protein